MVPAIQSVEQGVDSHILNAKSNRLELLDAEKPKPKKKKTVVVKKRKK